MIRIFSNRLACIAIFLLAVTAGRAVANGPCDHCGCSAMLSRVCRPVYTTKRVESTVWEAVCQEYCVPRHLPQPKCDDGCTCEQPVCYECQSPGNGPKTRNRLIQKPCVKQVPVILWVVEHRCDECAGDLPPAPAPMVDSQPIATKPNHFGEFWKHFRLPTQFLR